MRGIIFDIKDFALHDGAGIRTTVFLKGCPLRCAWCHNPEGLSPAPELYRKGGCVDCGLCRTPCDHPDCAPFGRCLHVCPANRLRVSGVPWDSEALAARLLKKKDIYDLSGGGVTLSGGEPLLQAEFSLSLLTALEGRVHRALETSGYAPEDTFLRVAEACDFVYMDLKLFDPEAHRRMTGVDNTVILENARRLREMGIPHTFRIPLIPGITDTEENLRGLSSVAGDSPVELLPCNPLAPAKYGSVGRVFSPDVSPDAPVSPRLSLFRNATLRR